eukprot:GHVU01168152.1.p2 GENE.GHVU01168152.1~~GHVU01168152.1.p2  ORF type:complete len:117 (+),score=6.71 GHVU01168152.1:321-671(+)
MGCPMSEDIWVGIGPTTKYVSEYGGLAAKQTYHDGYVPVSCQLAKPGPGRGRLPLVQERAGSPFDRVALDLVGPMPPSRRGKRYLLVIQDCFTKWLEVVPIPNKTSLVVTEAFTTK